MWQVYRPLSLCGLFLGGKTLLVPSRDGCAVVQGDARACLWISLGHAFTPLFPVWKPCLTYIRLLPCTANLSDTSRCTSYSTCHSRWTAQVKWCQINIKETVGIIVHTSCTHPHTTMTWLRSLKFPTLDCWAQGRGWVVRGAGQTTPWTSCQFNPGLAQWDKQANSFSCPPAITAAN